MLVKSSLIFLASIAAASAVGTEHVNDFCYDSNGDPAPIDCCPTVFGNAQATCTGDCTNYSTDCYNLCKTQNPAIPSQALATCSAFTTGVKLADRCYLDYANGGFSNDNGGKARCCVCTFRPGDDPWITGLSGQRFLFEGKDGKWYNLLHDPIRDLTINTHIYEVKDKRDDTPSTFFDGMAFTIKADDDEEHRILLKVKDTKNFNPKCEEKDQVCIANGALHVEIDGVEITEPSYHDLGSNLAFGIYNAPWECKERPTSHDEWHKVQAAMKQKKNRGRRLVAVYEPEIEILRQMPINNVFDEEKCREWFKERHMGRDVFKQTGKHATAILYLYDFVIRLEYTLNTDPKWVDHQRFDISFLGYGAKKDASGTRIASGILGETAQLKYDAMLHTPVIDGRDEVLSGPDEDYEVAGPFAKDFVARARSEAGARI